MDVYDIYMKVKGKLRREQTEPKGGAKNKAE